MNEEERIKKIENTLERLRDKAVVALAKVGLNPDSLQPDNGLFRRLDKIEHDIKDIKKSLEGNVTWRGLYTALLTAGSVMTALLFLAGLLMKLMNE